MMQLGIHFEPKQARFETEIWSRGEPMSEGAIQLVTQQALIDCSAFQKAASGERIPVAISSSARMLSSHHSMINIGYEDRLAVYANFSCGVGPVHPEFIAEIPEELDALKDMFVGFGALALHILRSSGLTFGENLVVIGLGIAGNLFCQVANCAGFNVIGLDNRKHHVRVARDSGIRCMVNSESEKWQGLVRKHLGSQSIDGLFIFNATEDIAGFAGLLREGGAITYYAPVSGIPTQGPTWGKGLVERNLYKSLPDVSRSCYYPYSYVRWSFKQELQHFTKMLCDKNLTFDALFESIGKVALSRETRAFKMPEDGGLLGFQLEFADDFWAE